MLCALIALSRADETPVDPCASYNSSCMLCMDHKDTCFYCFDKDTKKSKCVSVEFINSTKCEHLTEKLDKKCVETLGGDALDRNRYFFGGVLLVFGIATDLIVRFCSKPNIKDEFAHL